MAFAAATSLEKTIKRLLHNPDIYLVPPSRKIIKLARNQALYLRDVLIKLDGTSKGRSRTSVNALDDEIREAVFKFEDLLESRVSDQFLSQSDQERNGDMFRFSIDLLDLNQDRQIFIKRVKKLKIAYKKALTDMPVDEDDVVVSPPTGLDGDKSKLVGLCDGFRELKVWLKGGTLELDSEIPLMGITGMGGIGKTILANEVFEDPDVISHFTVRAWVKVGRDFKLNEIGRVILAQVNPDYDQNILAQGYDSCVDLVKESLKGRRFLIVLDDVWEKQLPHDMHRFFPKDNNIGSRVLVTTRIYEVGIHYNSFEMPFLSKEESWDLLREKVFAQDQSCPRQLEKAGKRIADKCDGLPLTIVTVAKLLSKADMSPEYWDEVAESRNSVFMDVYNEVSKVLYPSYNYLPQYVKMCFIYCGVFPKNCVIRRSKLQNMLKVEEFLMFTSLYLVTSDLLELVNHRLVIVYQETSAGGYIFESSKSIKTCGVHSSLWHLCNREARKMKSFLVLTSRKDGLSEDIKGQRRLSVHNNILFGIKVVHNTMEDDCASTARSLLCFGPYHPYQVPVTFGLRLLRLLDALTIRFYEFPMDVLNLVLLRYLALTCNGELPGSISKLWNLQFLIIRPHLRIIKGNRAPSYLPTGIWDLKALKHLQVTGSDLPDPNFDSFLPNLSTLLDVSYHTCTRRVLERIPKLKKLGIRIELSPNSDETLSCFAHISCLQKLKRLKCIIVNPEHMPKIIHSPIPLSNFPSSIQKLSLNGMGYPWEEMRKIASLPNLKVLKLRNYAFRGPKWEVKKDEFTRLRALVIEDTDLEQWKVGDECFRNKLNLISLKHCYKLEDVHWGGSYLPDELQVVDCNPLAISYLKQIINMRVFYWSKVNFDTHSSWVDGEFKQQVSKKYPWLL